MYQQCKDTTICSCRIDVFQIYNESTVVFSFRFLFKRKGESIREDGIKWQNIENVCISFHKFPTTCTHQNHLTYINCRPRVLLKKDLWNMSMDDDGRSINLSKESVKLSFFISKIVSLRWVLFAYLSQLFTSWKSLKSIFE